MSIDSTATEGPELPSAAPSGAGPTGWQQLWGDHRLFLAVVSAQLLGGMIVTLAGAADVVRPSTWKTQVLLWFLQATVVGGLLAAVYYRTQVRDVHGHRIMGRAGWAAAAGLFWRTHGSMYGLGSVVVAVVGLSVSTMLHDAWKGAIPQLHPFAWDPWLADLDRAIHGGTAPWRLMHPWLARQAVTRAIDAFYWLWYPLLTYGIMWQVWSTNRRARQRFLIAYALTFVLLGAFLAGVFASMGPCFIDRYYGGPSEFAPLMEYLRTVHRHHPLIAVEYQERLWNAFRSGHTDYWMSISAMPSLHVAMPALFALASRQVNRWLASMLWLVTGLTLVSSVHLGWHYAIDGYVAILGVIAVWALSGWLVRLANTEASVTVERIPPIRSAT